MKTIPIPAVGNKPAFNLDPENPAQVRNLIARAEAYFALSRKAWLKANSLGSRMTPLELETQTHREIVNADNGAALLAPLHIRTDWPGLFPVFHVADSWGENEHHVTESAVLAALGKTSHWLKEGASVVPYPTTPQ